jgi:hypothetical protein
MARVTLVTQIDICGAFRGIQKSAKTGFEGKSKLNKSGYDEGQRMSWNAAQHPADNTATVLIGVDVMTTSID